MINLRRLMKHLREIGEIGKTDNGGITRLAFSKEYTQALTQLEELCAKKGYTPHIDAVGNLFCSYNPSGAEDFIMVGSHLDTVKNGGLYDGALGIFTALEVLDSLKEEQIPLRHGIVVAAFQAEEGSEMGGTFGSRTICSRTEYTKALEEKLRTYNLTFSHLRQSEMDFSHIKAFLELHIEQGQVLEHNQKDLGIVDGIVGITRYDIVLHGTSNHAGTTPMKLRDDPVKSLPCLLEKLYLTADKYEHPFVMTVGDILVSPGMYNIIPAQVLVKVEVRDMEQNNIDEFFREINGYLHTLSLRYEMVKNIEKPSVRLNPDLITLLQDVAKEKGYPAMVLSSGAGHDAKELSHIVPTAMIFVPSVGGVSHSPKEWTKEEHIALGAQYLQEVLVKWDEVNP